MLNSQALTRTFVSSIQRQDIKIPGPSIANRRAHSEPCSASPKDGEYKRRKLEGVSINEGNRTEPSCIGQCPAILTACLRPQTMHRHGDETRIKFSNAFLPAWVPSQDTLHGAPSAYHNFGRENLVATSPMMGFTPYGTQR